MTLSQSAFGDADEEVVAGEAGIVDEDVDIAHRGFRLRREFIDGLAVGEIAGKDVHAIAEPPAASFWRASTLVSEMATVAPCLCRARAMPPPIEPLAPVIRAFLPVSSNIGTGNGRGAPATWPPLVLKVGFVYTAFEGAGVVVHHFIDFSMEGAKFVFGNMADPRPEARRNLVAIVPRPRKLVVSVCLRRLAADSVRFGVFHGAVSLRHLAAVVRALARIMVYLMNTSGAETLSVAANVFMGQTEAPLIIRPYVPRMTNSELFVLMASGMAHISGGLMAVYISYGADPVAVISTCVMACPCSLYLSKLFLPEVSKPETGGMVHKEGLKSPYVNAIDAAAAGTSDGLQLALNVAAMLIVFIAFVAMFNGILGLIDTTRLTAWTGWNFPDHITLQWIFGKMFSPVAFLMGVAIERHRARRHACWASSWPSTSTWPS